MSGSASKNKGKSYEREVCKFLTDLTGMNFQRVPNSGAFIGGKNQFREQKLTKEQKLLADGDIIVPSQWAHVSLECKFYKDFAWHQLLQKENQTLDKWISQASHTSKDLWILCFKINRQGSFVVFDIKHKEHFILSDHIIYKNKIIHNFDSFFIDNHKIIGENMRYAKGRNIEEI